MNANHSNSPSKVAVLGALTAFIGFVILYPLGALIMASFSPDNGAGTAHVSMFHGYILLLQNADLLGHTIVVALGATLVASLFGVSLAWIITRTDIPLPRTVEQLVLIPFYMTPLLGAIAWVILAAPDHAGLLNNLAMSLFGLTGGIFNIYSPTGISWVMGIYYAPFSYLFAAAALRSMDASFEECSAVLGAGTLRTAVRITGPLILPAILAGVLLVFVLSIEQFGVPAVLGMPRGYNVLTTKIYQFVSGFDPDYAAAAAMGLPLIVFAAAGIYLQHKMLGGRNYTTVTGRAFRQRRIRVRYWRIPLFSFCCFYVLVSVVLPTGSLIWASLLKWMTADIFHARLSLDNYRYVLFDYPTTLIAIRNTLTLAIGGACIITAISVVVAWLMQRTTVPGRRILEYVVAIPLGVPGIVFSIGLLWAWIRFPVLNIYGTLWILLIGYITIFLPYGVRTIAASLVQIDRSLEECAAVLGAPWGKVLWSITMPLLKPGIWAAWTLLLVSIVKELSASAFLYSSKSVVLSVAVFDLFVSGSFTYVAALSLIQAIIIFLILFIARRVGGVRDMSVG